MDLYDRRTSAPSKESPERTPNADPLSPGPMTLSDLKTPPKRLQPITKQTKTRKTSAPLNNEAPPTNPHIDSTALNKMRARLDPFYNSPLPSVAVASEQPHVSTKAVPIPHDTRREEDFPSMMERPLPSRRVLPPLPPPEAAAPPDVALVGVQADPTPLGPSPNTALVMPTKGRRPSQRRSRGQRDSEPPNHKESNGSATGPPDGGRGRRASTVAPGPQQGGTRGGKEASPGPQQGGTRRGKEASPGFQQGGVQGGKDASPESQKGGTRRGKDASPESQKGGTRRGKEASPESQKGGTRRGKEASPESQEGGTQGGKEASPESQKGGTQGGKDGSPGCNRPESSSGVETVVGVVSSGEDSEGNSHPHGAPSSPDPSVGPRPLPEKQLHSSQVAGDKSAGSRPISSLQTGTRQTLGCSGMVSEEDIVESSPAPTAEALNTETALTTGVARQPRSTEVLFVERDDGSGFVTKKLNAHGVPSDVRGGSPTPITFLWGQDITSTKLALCLHNLFQRVLVSLLGLLSGLSLWHCVVALVLSMEGSGHLNLLQQYHSLTLPLHTLHLLILLPTMASMLDRVDILRPSRQCAVSYVHRPANMFYLAAMFSLFFALMITVSQTFIDDKIQLYSISPGLWTAILTITNTSSPSSGVTSPTSAYMLTSHPVSSQLTAWLVLSVLRAVCCSLSSVAISWFTEYDRLKEYLQAVDDRCNISQNNSEPTQK